MDYCQEALAIARAVGDDYLVAELLDEQAWVLVSQGQADAALPLTEQGLADLGHALEPLEARLAGLDRQRLRAAMGAEAFDAEYAAGRTLDLARAAHQALQGISASREPPRAGALVSEPDAAVSGEPRRC